MKSMAGIAIACGLTLGVAAQNGNSSTEALPAQPVKVAVNGRVIDTSGLVPYRVSAEDLFRLKHKRTPIGPTDEAELTKSIDDSRCQRLVSLIESAVIHEQFEKYGVTATEAEQRAYLAKFPDLAHPESIAAQTRERGLALRDGFASVYDKGQSPEAVYQKSAARIGYTKEVWLMYVELARDPARRPGIYGWMIETTAEQVRSAAGRFDTANAIKLSKLKRLIYEDPATKPFREFPPGTVVVSEKDAVFHNFLRAEMSKSTVSLDNLGWYGRCGLGNLGIQVPGAGQ